MTSKIPTNIKQLMTEMCKRGIGEDDMYAFQEEVDDEDMYDIEVIKEDMENDQEESMLFDWFRDTLSVGETAYHIVKAIVEGTEYKSSVVHKRGPTPASDLSYLLRRLCYTKPMFLKPTWSHVVEAVRHEMYALMASKMEQASADKDQFDLASQSVDDVIKELKGKKGGVSGNEIAYIEQLVQRATELDRPSATISFEQCYVRCVFVAMCKLTHVRVFQMAIARRSSI